jgi:plastocyanin
MRPRHLILLVLAVALAGCGTAGGATDGGYGAAETTSPPSTTAPQPTGKAAGGATGDYGDRSAADDTSGRQELHAAGAAWSPADLTVEAGTPVVLRVSNDDQALHNFTLQPAGVSQDLASGEASTVRFTAPEAGTYQFFCKYHQRSMVGTLTVW